MSATWTLSLIKNSKKLFYWKLKVEFTPIIKKEKKSIFLHSHWFHLKIHLSDPRRFSLHCSRAFLFRSFSSKKNPISIFNVTYFETFIMREEKKMDKQSCIKEWLKGLEKENLESHSLWMDGNFFWCENFFTKLI